MSTITARAPLPVSGFVNASGSRSSDSVYSPRPTDCMAKIRPYLMSSKMPLAMNTLMTNSIATRYGMIMTAMPKPSFAPVTNDSYMRHALDGRPDDDQQDQSRESSTG